MVLKLNCLRVTLEDTPMKNKLLLLVFACALFTQPTLLDACSCVDICKPESACIRTSFKHAAAVFVGTPVDVVLQHREYQLGNRTVQTINYHVRFAIKESFKGITTSFAVSDTGSGGGDCSYGKMDEGRDYLVYADSVSNGSVVDIHGCSRTAPLDAGLWSKPSPDSNWSEESRKSMAAAQKGLQKELVLLRKIRSRKADASQ